MSSCVALLTILPRQEHIIPVCLPGLRQHFVGQYAFVVGWGRTEHGVAQTPSLLQVSGRVLSMESGWNVQMSNFQSINL